jgi:hypothetical protein
MPLNDYYVPDYSQAAPRTSLADAATNYVGMADQMFTRNQDRILESVRNSTAHQERLAQAQLQLEAQAKQRAYAIDQTKKLQAIKEREAILDEMTYTVGGLKDKPLLDRQAAARRTLKNLQSQGFNITDKAFEIADDPEQFQAYERQLQGRWDAKYGRFNYKGSSMARNRQDWILPDGTPVTIGDIDGVPTNLMTNEPLTTETHPKALGGEMLESITAGDVKSRKNMADVNKDVVADYKADAREARKQMLRVKTMEVAARRLTDKDFGLLNKPTEWSRALGQTINAMTGVDLVDVDTTAQGVVDLVGSLRTTEALGFTAETKGSISDREMDLFINAVPGLTRSRSGYMLVVEGFKRIAQRKIDANAVANKLIMANKGVPPQDLEDQVAAHFKDKPIFTEAELDRFTGAGNTKSELVTGAKQVGTSDGKPVYEEPDGTRWVGE